MPSKRTTRFVLAIVAGLALGLFYGWFLQPRPVRRASPQNLRQDYQTDYVLMVAEVYASEGNVAEAAERLHFLGEESVNSYVQQAILAAGQFGYDRQDIESLGELSQALATWIPQPDGGTP